MHSTRSLEVHKYKTKSGSSFSFFKSNETLEILFRNVHLNFYKKIYKLYFQLFRLKVYLQRTKQIYFGIN